MITNTLLGKRCKSSLARVSSNGKSCSFRFKFTPVILKFKYFKAKLWNSNHRPEHVRLDLEATLKDLQVSYVDSFVIHWPQVRSTSSSVIFKMFRLFLVMASIVLSDQVAATPIMSRSRLCSRSTVKVTTALIWKATISKLGKPWKH